MIFISRYRYTVDQKGRLFIPTEYREQIGQEFVCRIIEKPYPLIQCMSSQQLCTEYARFKARNIDTLDIDTIDDEFYSSVFKLKCDAQGRIIIGQEARASAELGEDVYVFGAGETFKIISAENYAKMKEATARHHDKRTQAENQYYENNINTLAAAGVGSDMIIRHQQQAQGDTENTAAVPNQNTMNEMLLTLMKMMGNMQGGGAQ